MALGAFAPLPLRLGGSPEEGVTAAQFLAITRDVAAVNRVAPFARMTIDQNEGDPQILWYSGRNGVGESDRPTLAWDGVSQRTTITWPARYRDPIGNAVRVRLASASGSIRAAIGALRVDDITAPNQLSVVPTSRVGALLTSATYYVEVRTHDDADTRPAIYGGVPTKLDHATEGDIPAAWGMYQLLQSVQGKAYSKDLDGYLHCENLADARLGAAIMQAGEKLAANSYPGTSDESLEHWTDDVYGVRIYADDSREDIRAKVAARFKMSVGNSLARVSSVLRALLGDTFLRVVTFTGDDIDNPTLRTYWPGVNPGTNTFNLGDNDGDLGDKHGQGAWYSDHNRILILVDKDSRLPPKKLARLLNVELNDLISRMLPATTFWSWAYSDTFTLDVSRLGTAAMSE